MEYLLSLEPFECRGCDYQWVLDCNEGCIKLREEEKND